MISSILIICVIRPRGSRQLFISDLFFQDHVNYFYKNVLNLRLLSISGLLRLEKYDQQALHGQVVSLLVNMIASFSSIDLLYVWSMRGSKVNVYNCQCRNVEIASAVKGRFATLIKSKVPPAYLEGVKI